MPLYYMALGIHGGSEGELSNNPWTCRELDFFLLAASNAPMPMPHAAIRKEEVLEKHQVRACSSIDVTSSQPLPSPLSLIMIGPRMIGFVIEG